MGDDMSDSPSAPTPVDPYAQAGAQYGLSTGTALFNAGLNRTNQVNPLGSSTWSTSYPNGTGGSAGGMGPIGGSGLPVSAPATPVAPAPVQGGASGGGIPSLSGHDLRTGGYGGYGLGGPSQAAPSYGGVPSYGGLPTGGPTGGAPTYTQTTQLAPQFQDVLNKPIDTTGLAGMPGGPSTTQDLQNTQDALYQKQMQYLAPEQKLASEQMDSKLANMGATYGSPAWNNEQDRLSREQQAQTSDARTQAITGAGAEQSRLFGLGGQSLQNQLAIRNAPISEYAALSGTGSPSASALTPDISGAFGQQYQGQLAGYNAGVASNNQTESTIGSLAAMAAIYF